ncbi:leucine-rich repeat-containing protein kinase family protein [Pedobacter rhizosphaerae]|uniref:Protein tyrosine kinase n=1 Tax=Pedobacter rhizosphaerae TaxID=390241 RepID=A0A1H9UY53_9SPHI|nr:leucine-rich repeat-containing protein kinase family protein [Pedobacter rhizosphaerae]SES13987.1 Protein tyrosine kinase [Pedobacter rhizosphaerae]
MQTLKQLLNGELKGATSIKLSENLTEFPEAIFDLAETLEVLDLSSNQLSKLPVDFGRLKKLRIFFCSDNLFTVLPEVMAECPLLDIVGFKSNQITFIPPRALNPNLRWLILTNNQISVLPKEIGNCIRMQKLMLAGNRISELPQELGNCMNMGLLRISANQIKILPEWLLQLPKLAWLAFSGNQFNNSPNINSIPEIISEDIELSHQLGEGASGTIYRAKRLIENDQLDVAVKVFKGTVTSDGFPEDEMKAFIAAGNHPGLVKLQGEINLISENRKGLVMDLIPADYYNLGNPPSLISCTRDVFNPENSLSTEQMLKIASTIASVAAQLHQNGIKHGDLYAHNILVDEEGNTLFSDFGAASFYDQRNANQAFFIERIEVRAYGYLLDDLLSIAKTTGETITLNKLSTIRTRCLAMDLESRPSFKEIVDELSQVD